MADQRRRRTGQNDKQFKLNTVPSAGRRTNTKSKGKAKPQAKPKPSSTSKPKVPESHMATADAAAVDRELAALRASKATKPSSTPAPKPSASRPSAPTRSTTSSSSTPKPADKVPSSNAGMKNQNKDFRGNPERKDSIASTLRELRGMGSGRKVSGVGPVSSGSDYAKGVASSKSSKPEDKSRYVAPDGRQYAGPAYGNGSKEQNGNSNSSTYTAQSDGAKKLQEAQKERAAKAKRDAEERAKKARERLTASASKKPGSTYG